MQFLQSNTGNKFYFIKSQGANKISFVKREMLSSLLWDFTTSPSGKTLTAFNVHFENGGVTANWGDGSSQILTSGVNYNKTFS